MVTAMIIGAIVLTLKKLSKNHRKKKKNEKIQKKMEAAAAKAHAEYEETL